MANYFSVVINRFSACTCVIRLSILKLYLTESVYCGVVGSDEKKVSKMGLARNK